MVLIDIGATVEGYHSDITRSYVFGEPTPRQRDVWNIERDAQLAAFEAALPGNTCEAVDAAARSDRSGRFWPGLCGARTATSYRSRNRVDVHEWSYLVQGNQTVLQSGMCFSNEPMICIYGEFGVRLEDHFYITDEGPRWFTSPCADVLNPFGYT